MRKIIAIAAMTILTVAAQAGQSKGNYAVGFGQEITGDKASTAASLTLGNKYFFTTGIVIGGEIGIGYTTVPTETEESSMISLDTNLKVGYSFGGETGKGLGIYGLYGYRLGAYQYTYDSYSGEKTKTTNAVGSGAGVQVEYVFNNGLTTGVIYQNYNMIFDTVGSDLTSENENITLRIGYQW